MTRAYRYSFAAESPSDDIESTLVLGGGGRGEPPRRVRRPAGRRATPSTPRGCRCVIEAGTPVGRDLCRLFTGFCAASLAT